jgi:enoyl-CoA hydratase/3-hydroxyacyl-CoA dehydrogenase
LISYKVVNKNDTGVAVLSLHSKPVNALSEQMMNAIRTQINRAYNDKHAKAVVIASDIPGFFVAGADISQIMSNQYDPRGKDVSFYGFLHKNNELLNQIESGPKPTVAAIDGVALGGGLELAMATNARVCSPQSRLGLPELNLGLIPGFGGTQRLPRLIGVEKALEMMLTMTPISGIVAGQLKLADRVVESDKVKEAAIDLAVQIANHQHKRSKSLHLNNRLESPDKIREILEKQEANAKRFSSHLPHVQACINAVKAGLEYNGEVGLETEQREFLRICDSDTAKGLVHFFFAERATTKIPGLSSAIKPKPIKKLGVIGGGTMGSGIAIAAISNGISVILKEVNDQALDAAVKRVREVLDGRLERKRITQQQYKDQLALFKPQTTYDGFKELDMVIEAVLEIIPLKQKIFQELEQQCNSNCILATNTSTIDISEIAKNTKAQDRVIGLHFFSPAHVMVLLEIIITKQTSHEAIAGSIQFSKQIKKTPIVVGNCPGFLVNRAFYPYGQAAHYLLDRGVDIYQIDKAIQSFGFRVGPFLMNDIAGVDVIKLAFGSMHTPFAARSYPIRLNHILVENKRLGSKTGAGNYKHDQKTGRPSPDPEIKKFVEQARKQAGNPPAISNITNEQIVEYLLYPAVNEACRIIDEGHVYRVSDVDIASSLGMNFPRHTGGLMKWADSVGAKKIYSTLNKLYNETGLKLFEPSPYLTRCATNDESLYSFDKKK